MLTALFVMTFLCGAFFGAVVLCAVAYFISQSDERKARHNMRYAKKTLGAEVIDTYENPNQFP